MSTHLNTGPSTTPTSRSRPRIISWRSMFTVVVCLAALGLAASIAHDFWIYDGPNPDLSAKIWLLDVDFEGSAFTWFSIIMAFFIAQTAYRCGVDDALENGRFWFHWYLLALLFLLVSFDDFATLHEKFDIAINKRFQPTGILYHLWAVPAGILSVLGIVAFLPFIRSFPPRISLQLILAAVLFLTGAVGLELLGGNVRYQVGVDTLRYRLFTNAEEGLEIAGLLTFIHALYLHRETAAARRS